MKKDGKTTNKQHSENTNNRADKMSGWMTEMKKYLKGHSMKFWKKFYSKKRRKFLKDENNWDKL